jgi:hypothetical protein
MRNNVTAQPGRARIASAQKEPRFRDDNALFPTQLGNKKKALSRNY